MTAQFIRRMVSVLATAFVLAGGIAFGVVAPATAGVLDTEIHDGQAFAVQRSPAYPTCSISGGTFDNFVLSQFERPYSTPAGQNTADMGSDYLKLLASNDTAHPWRLGRFNAAGSELHYDSGTSSWVDSSNPNYASDPQWDDAGIVMALYSDGYFYESYPNGYGLFISLTTTYSLGGGTSYTPTSDYNDCTNTQSYGEVALAKGSAISSGGSGGATPTIDLTLDLQVGSKLDGATTTIAGDGLKANSAYDLTMHSDPVVVTQGTTDGNGAFSETVTIPTEACMPGLHELTLSGVDPSDVAVSDTKYLELASDCTVMQISDSALTASMPDTGVSIRNGSIVVVTALLMFGLAFFVYRSRRGLRFASVNDSVARTLSRLESSLARMEARSQKAAARRRLRK